MARPLRPIVISGLVMLLMLACGHTSFDFPAEGLTADAGDEASTPSTNPSLACAAPEIACGSSCVDPRTDPNNCGQCEARCTGATPVCDRGVCAASCATGLVDCGGACVDTSSDRAHCSACGSSCTGNDVCTGGKCACPAGKERCGPSCVVLGSDPLNCGGCGIRCDGSTPVCNVGQCRPSCTGGLTACAGACVDLRSDPEHCGDCALVCTNGACTRGNCVCESGQVLCGKRCVDTSKDGNNCGVCGRGCPGSTVCNNGTCE